MKDTDTEAARLESFALTNEANDKERYRHRGGSSPWRRMRPKIMKDTDTEAARLCVN